MHRLQRAVSVLLLLVFCTGCYHYYVAAPEFDPATEPQRRVIHSLAWGLANNPKAVLAQNCKSSNALDQVRISSNLGYALLTVLTLGFWSPVEVEWRCAKHQEKPDVIGSMSVPDVPAKEDQP